MSTAIVETKRQQLHISAKLERAKAVFAYIKSQEKALFGLRDSIMMAACEIGELLDQLKDEVGHGRWLIWLISNFRELGKSDDMIRKQAERCMAFYRKNPNWKNSSNFDPESVRKFMWGYIPEKERPELEGDSKDAPNAHYLTFVNNFSKWDRQVQIGQAQMPSVDVLRHELENTLRRIIDLCGKDWVLTLVR